ncbi:MAG: ABC transporter permease subunit [Candidatus Bathyarchaeia archaeon]|jgi:ABC-2 type transport system permease protein
MELANVWIVASKDLGLFLKKKSILYSTILFPVIAALGLPLVIEFAGQAVGGIPAAVLPGVINAFLFFFIIAAVSLPVGIAAYSLVGEKVEKSLEPLLATPLTDGEILLGKSIAAFLPPVLATYLGAAIFAAFVDALTIDKLGYLYFPNVTLAVILFAVVPLVCILSVEAIILVSAKANDVRAAQQFGGVLVFPFVVIYVAGEIGVLTLNATTLALFSGVLLAVDVLLFFLSRGTFQREEILTKWK